jgi:hypothetical protein
MAKLELVIVRLDLYTIFGNAVGLPREICVIIENLRIAKVKKYYDIFVNTININYAPYINCSFCIDYAPTKLLQTKYDIIKQANKKNPTYPRISHILLVNKEIYDVIDYLYYLLDDIDQSLINILQH